MAKYPLNLGSTFNEFLNALNTNTEDTEGIIEGTKKVKKLSLGEGDELGNIEIITKDNKKVVSIYGESIFLDVSHDDETSSLQIGDTYSEIYSENGRIHLEAGDGISLHSNKNDTAKIELDATNDSENGRLILKADEINIEGDIDFTNANVQEIKIGNANIEWNEAFENYNKSLLVKIDEGNGSLQFNADSVVFNSNESVTIERAGMNGINANNSGIYIYDENIDTGNCANINLEDGIISLSADNKIDFSGQVDFSNATVTGLPSSGGSNIPEEVINYDSESATLLLDANYVYLYADTQIEVAVGENQDTTFYLEQNRMEVRSEGVVNFTGYGGINFTAGEETSTKFNGSVDFTNANVVGLPSGGGSSPLAIQVNELPTENIDNSKVYIVAENPQVYLKMYGGVLTLENILEGFGVTNPVVNYHVVPTLPTEGEVTDFVTMTPTHCYINSSNGIAYFYGNLGAGNMWVNAGALLAQLTGVEAEDAGRTYSISDELTELNIRIYTYWEDVQYVYTINNQWCKVNYSNGFNPDNDYIFTGRNSFEGSTHLKNNVTIGNSDAGNIGIVNFFTEQVTFHHGKVTFNNGHESDIDGGVEFYGKVDFTNAIVTGLSGGGLSQEEVQEMINTAINGALEGSY